LPFNRMVFIRLESGSEFSTECTGCGLPIAALISDLYRKYCSMRFNVEKACDSTSITGLA